MRTATSSLRAMMTVVDAVNDDRPLGLALRLEAFYQHYARFALMDGAEALARPIWWAGVLRDAPAVASRLAIERDHEPHDAEGARL